MARIRTIKPAYNTSEKIAQLTIPCRLHFVLLWTYADDEGRGIDHPKIIKGAIWPLDDNVTAAKVEQWQQELAEHGRIERYEVDGKPYFQIHDFNEHQKPNHPAKSKYPAPSGHPLEDSSNPLEDARDGVPVVVVVGVDVEKPPVPPAPTPKQQAEPTDRAPQAVRTIFDTWIQATGRSGRTRLDHKRQRLIRKALDEYPPEDVADAVQGWRHSPHHRGENPQGTTYNDLELLLRDAAHIEKFRDLNRTSTARPAATPGMPRPLTDEELARLEGKTA